MVVTYYVFPGRVGLKLLLNVLLVLLWSLPHFILSVQTRLIRPNLHLTAEYL